MDDTRQSLLFRTQNGATNAWKDLTDLYRPLILAWLNRPGVPARELEDLCREVLLSVVQHLPDFLHTGHQGAFRSWLRTIVCRRSADYWRARRGHPGPGRQRRRRRPPAHRRPRQRAYTS
jgi:DNA-directed RNA polymerase specialized sigma24 family protein